LAILQAGFLSKREERTSTQLEKMKSNRRKFIQNDNIPGWEVESGPVNIMVGSSSQDIKLQNSIIVN